MPKHTEGPDSKRGLSEEDDDEKPLVKRVKIEDERKNLAQDEVNSKKDIKNKNITNVKVEDNSGDDDDDDDDDDDEEEDDEGDEEEDKDEEEEDDKVKKHAQIFTFDGVDYSYKERAAIIEENEGKIEFRVVNNDNTKESIMILTGLKNIFQKQLPKMPREYIARLVYDKSHISIAIVRKPLTVVGGITFRPFESRKFAEIVFCAISSTEQIRGYGAHLMNHLKDYVKATSQIMYFLTYADNYAIGYFKKQGFTKEITLDRSIWMGYIKDYEGGTIMQCSMIPRIRYLDGSKILLLQKAAIMRKIRGRSKSYIRRKGIEAFKNGVTKIDPMDIPGLKESGWTPEMDELARRPKRGPHFAFMQHLLNELQNHKSSWPFSQPVN